MIRNQTDLTLVLYHGTYREVTQEVSSTSEHCYGFRNVEDFSRVFKF